MLGVGQALIQVDDFFVLSVQLRHSCPELLQYGIVLRDQVGVV